MTQEVFCILGMHRSGTSCLAGSLQAAGLALGANVSEWNPFNRRGNRENPGFNLLHDRLLKDNGGSWDAPPESIKWFGHHEALGRALISEYEGLPRWGFKDPKTLVGLAGWRRLIGPLRRVGIFRHPLAVAHSLQSRNKGETDYWVQLWVHYNRLLLAEYEREPFPMLSFDWDEETFHARLDTLLPTLDLGPLPEGERFYTGELHHHRLNEGELSKESEEMYEQLQSIAEEQR